MQRVDATGKPAHPFELKLMGVLRHIVRGEVCDTIEELAGEYISAECFRKFTHWFCVKIASIKDEFIRPPDSTNAAEMQACMKNYTAAGLHGAFASTDGVAVAWANPTAQLKPIAWGNRIR